MDANSKQMITPDEINDDPVGLEIDSILEEDILLELDPIQIEYIKGETTFLKCFSLAEQFAILDAYKELAIKFSKPTLITYEGKFLNPQSLNLVINADFSIQTYKPSTEQSSLLNLTPNAHVILLLPEFFSGVLNLKGRVLETRAFDSITHFNKDLPTTYYLFDKGTIRLHFYALVKNTISDRHGLTLGEIPAKGRTTNGNNYAARVIATLLHIHFKSKLEG